MFSSTFPNVTLLLLASIFLSSCSEPPSALKRVLDRGELIVLTQVDPAQNTIEKSGANEFEYELINRFSKQIGVSARFLPAKSFQHILQITSGHEADFSAASLTVTRERQKFLMFTPPYYEVTQQLIYHYRTRRPKNIAQLNSGFFEVIKGSSHAENLRLLKPLNPSLKWQESETANVFELLSLVNEGILDYTIADSNQFEGYRGQFPELNTAFDISSPESIAWAFPKSNDTSLYDEAIQFLNEIKKDGTLDQLKDKYFGYSKSLNYVSLCTFRQHLKHRLPALKPFFKLAAKEYQMDWMLLAAVAYQESHWSAQAVSPTGVKGIMMLTKATARQMGVSNRLDPQQSIDGGGHYLRTRINKIPARILEPDKTWMALASYNIGFGHLEDARILTQRQGADPDKWLDVEKRLPLLAKETWYKKTRHGYARGHEAVTYVRNIRQYHQLLRQLLARQPNLYDAVEDTFKLNLPAL